MKRLPIILAVLITTSCHSAKDFSCGNEWSHEEFQRFATRLDLESKVLSALDQELENCPLDSNLLLLSFYGYLHMGQNDRALTAYTRIAELGRLIPEVDANAGYMYSEAGKHELAVESFTKAIALEDGVDLRLERAKSFASLGKRTEAIVDLEAAMERIRAHNPHEFPGVTMAGDNAYSDEVAALLAELYLQENRHAEAILLLKEVLEMNPESAPIKNKIEALVNGRIE